ncbi:MAG: polysaccharide deacetylase family protein [Candidatus Competibacteraceae bacterium]
MLNNFKQKMLSKVFSEIPLCILEKITYPNLIIPYYHAVSDGEIPHIKHLYKHKNVNQFKEDIDFIAQNYSPISLRELLDFLKSGAMLPKKALLLTFDDGFREIHEVIAPILLNKGIPATFFLNSAFVDNKVLCYQHKASILAEQVAKLQNFIIKNKIIALFVENGIETFNLESGLLNIKYEKKHVLDEVAVVLNVDFNNYLKINKPYLTSSQTEELIKNGFTIGAHSIDHPLYMSLSVKEQLHQSLESLKMIKEKFCLDYGAFAFPHSDFGVSKNFFIEFYDSGLIDISFGTRGMLDDNLNNHFQRFSLEKPSLSARKIIALNYVRRIYKTTVLQRSIVRV